MLVSLKEIYPKLDIASHIIGDPISVSWESDPKFLGAFKISPPGHYRYNRRMFCHFQQDRLPPQNRGIFLAGDGISWTPGWAEGAVQTALNAVWGVLTHLSGETHAVDPGPGDVFYKIAPLELPD
jgi:tryptophan 2-monooxygenase